MNDIGYVEPFDKSLSPEDYDEAMMIMLIVDGMDCPNCATRIRNSLIKLDGVLEAHGTITSNWQKWFLILHILNPPMLCWLYQTQETMSCMFTRRASFCVEGVSTVVGR